MKKIFKKMKNKFSSSPESDSNSKNSELIEKIFLGIENSKASNQFESLPKVLLSKIFCYLDAKNITKVFVLNKFFLKIMTESSLSTNNTWKSFLERDGEVINQIELSSFLKEIKKSEYEKKMNSYHLYFKVERQLFFPFLIL